MPTPRSLLTLVLALLTATAVALPATASAAAKKPAVTVDTTFRTTWDVTVSYEHTQYWSGGVENNTSLSYRLTGPLGTAHFVDGTLQTGVVAQVKQSTRATLSVGRVHGDGTSATCTGGPADVRGFTAMGRLSDTRDHTWFAPLLGANVTAQCQSSDGESSTDQLSFAAVASGPVDDRPSSVPTGAVDLGITAETVEQPEFLKTFDITVKSHRCPGYDVESTTSCVLHLTGDVTFIRTSRTETPDISDLLGPVEVSQKPKLDKQRTKATTGVKCPRACDVGIEVFQLPKRKAPMAPFARKPMVRIKGGKATTVTVKLDAADRRIIAEDGAIAKITVKLDGKRRSATYPLALPEAP